MPQDVSKSVSNTHHPGAVPGVASSAAGARDCGLGWLLTRDHNTRLRMSMALTALALMLASSVVMGVLARAGVSPLRPVLVWALLSNLALVVPVVLIRTGASRRFRDPSLTVPQMVCTITSGAVAYVLAGAGRGVVPSVLAMILFFGTFGLTRRQMLAMGVYALVSFAVAISWGIVAGYHPVNALGAAYAGMVAVVLGGSLAINMRLQTIRERLHLQRSELKRALAENRALAMRDALTGLINRRHMIELLNLEVRRRVRGGPRLVVAQLDIDHFKRINDTHGHAVGDRALRDFADIVRATLRTGDVVSRWGGEEFVAMLHNVTEEEALQMAERVRQAVQLHRLEHLGQDLNFTVSIGMTAHRSGEAIESTLERADRCLYQAKRDGRNCVVSSHLDSLAPSLFA